MKTKVLLLVLALVMVGPTVLRADSIPYESIGAQATSFSFTAASTGAITAYFHNSDAGYTSVIGMSVNGAPVEFWGLNNHTSARGDSLVLGNANAGDSITFQLFVYDLGYAWSSDPTQNTDGMNHAYSTAFAGDDVIPAGTYIGFEDLYGGGDNDYNDNQFVVTNVATAVPEPGALALLGAGMLFMANMRRKILTK